jgi:Taurine catabolism dioxygenase TauD, TfdA family
LHHANELQCGTDASKSVKMAVHHVGADAQGYLSVAFIAKYYELSQRHEDLPRLTDLQREATAVFGALVNSDLLRLDLNLAPGDIQLVYNHNLVHTRSGFTDDEVRMAILQARKSQQSSCVSQQS